MPRMPKDKKIYFAGLISTWRWCGSLTRPRQMRLQRLRFLPQIARSLRSDSHDVYQGILALCDLNQSTDPEVPYSRILKNLVKYSTILHHWGRSLSDNPRSLIRISWSFLISDIKSVLTPLVGYMSLLLYYTDGQGNKHIILRHDEETLLQHCLLRIRRFARNLNNMRFFNVHSYTNEERTYVETPHIIASALWSTLAYNRHCEFVALLPRPLPHLPAILYKPSVTFHFLYEVSLEFSRSDGEEEPPRGHVYMQLRQTERGAEFCLTMQEYRFPPQTWERWQQDATYEQLRELGGSIEPLTWDEGYGQGVIVRLPWAKGTS
jgi:hypothetical protein